MSGAEPIEVVKASKGCAIKTIQTPVGKGALIPLSEAPSEDARTKND